MAKILIAVLLILPPFEAFAQSISGSWLTDSSGGFIARRNPSSITVGDSIYVICGIGPSGSREIPRVQVFSPMSHEWTTITSKGDTSKVGENYPMVISDSIYVVFSGTVFSFSIGTDTWDSIATTGNPNTLRYMATSCALNGKLYIIGGATATEFKPIDTMDVFDPSSRVWSNIPPAGQFTPRYGPTAVVLNGKIYVIGGGTFSGSAICTNVVEVFDPATNLWSRLAPTGTFIPKENMTSSVLDGKIYVMGGDTGIADAPLNLVDVFDPGTNSWSSAPSMPADGAFGGLGRRTELTSAVWNGKIFALGDTHHIKS